MFTRLSVFCVSSRWRQKSCNTQERKKQQLMIKCGFKLQIFVWKATKKLFFSCPDLIYCKILWGKNKLWCLKIKSQGTHCKNYKISSNNFWSSLEKKILIKNKTQLSQSGCIGPPHHQRAPKSIWLAWQNACINLK